MLKTFIFISFISVTLPIHIGWSQTPAIPVTAGQGLKDIDADQMSFEFRNEKTIVILKGNVRLVSDSFRLRADYVEGHQNAGGVFDIGYAEGNVRIYLQENTFLKGDRLNFDNELQKFVLGSLPNRPFPRTWKDGKVISAEEIIYDLRTENETKKLIYEKNVRVTDSLLPDEYFDEFPLDSSTKEDKQ